MAKITLTRTEQIPFVEDWQILQMVKFKVEVSATQEEGETIEEVEKQLDEVFERNLKKTMANDDIYNKLKKQLNYLATTIKEECPAKANKIIAKAKNINS